MSIFDVKKSTAWNYCSPEKPDYSEVLEGVIVGMDNPQAYQYQTGKKLYWDNGAPKRNIRLFVATDKGEKSITFTPKSALFNAFASTGIDSFEDLIRCKVKIATQEGKYWRENPRPWAVEVGDVVEDVKLHKVPVLNYETMNPVTGKSIEDEEIPF